MTVAGRRHFRRRIPAYAGMTVKVSGITVVGLRTTTLYTTKRLPSGRALPPWTDGSAHHFSAKRRTP